MQNFWMIFRKFIWGKRVQVDFSNLRVESVKMEKRRLTCRKGLFLVNLKAEKEKKPPNNISETECRCKMVSIVFSLRK